MDSLLFQLLFLFMLKFAMLCNMDNFDSTKLVDFGLIQYGSVLTIFLIVELIYKRDNYHLHNFGATYPKHVLYWFLYAHDS